MRWYVTISPSDLNLLFLFIEKPLIRFRSGGKIHLQDELVT
jgi:hypothetical protein